MNIRVIVAYNTITCQEVFFQKVVVSRKIILYKVIMDIYMNCQYSKGKDEYRERSKEA